MTAGGTSALRWISSAASDVGKVRTLNEDAFLERPDLGLWAIADGMGGHDAGDLASRRVVEALAAISTVKHLGTAVEEARYRLSAVNQSLRAEARERGELLIGTTVAALITVERHAAVLWAGDSRIYLYRGSSLYRLTRDHSQVEELIASGQLAPEDAENHPIGNVITRAVGGADEITLDAQIQEVKEGDICLLCSDGLTKELKDKEIAAILGRRDPNLSAQSLVNLACDRGGRDNVTAILVQFLGQS
jgi:serine/threonine protein phosphatase PrpC